MLSAVFVFVLLAGAMVSQVFSSPLLLAVFDSVNPKFVTSRMPLLAVGGKIGRNSARANILKSENPTKSFPNLHTIATGVSPKVHGVIANRMFDRDGNVMFNVPEQFKYDAKLVPIWADAVQNQIKTATFMWPGVDFTEDEKKPLIREKYSNEASEWDARITKIINSFKNEKIQFGMAYFEDTDKKESVDTYIEKVQNAIESLYDALTPLGIDIIIMSTHGTKNVLNYHVLMIDDYVSETNCNCKIIPSGPMTFIRFTDPEKLKETYKALKTVDLDGDGKPDHGRRYKVYKRDEADMIGWNLKDFDYLKITLFVVTMDEYAFYDKNEHDALASANVIRESGYHKDYSDMNGIFLVSGPSFENEYVDDYGRIELPEVYQLIKRLLDITVVASPAQKKENITFAMLRLVNSETVAKWRNQVWT